ncbi:flavin-nucleotide-binding protein [Paramyrothecium foliicola]|nr:flavin-nucleotide-binding protein [Paramyrothecium foliicola]
MWYYTMGRYDLQYPKDATNLVKRHGERGKYELETIHKLINSSQLLHVSFNPPDSPFPVILPMIGQMGSFERPSAELGDPLELYLHGYVSSRMMNLGRKSEGEGMPVCIAASHVDGLVLSLSAFNHSYNYRSAVLFGHAKLVEEPAEKLYAMEIITDSVVPGRWNDTRLPPTNAEMQSTSILRVKIASGSAKIRDGGCSDEKEDLGDEQLVASKWTGVLPVHQSYGEPIPGPYNQIDTPEYITDFVKTSNSENQDYSIEAVKKQKQGSI